ncbi:MAG: EAL domain-containing protein [Candidatus Thiodiazotropha lotti]|nr:EAL domain-containing protein [Candidatus Thiodiazotropha lotti]MCG8001667.1 EAL domain-containing protein [Candidatus Thiodiazotropha lotti]MCW4193441.1 EAL domain-containing protein [Candidatus Thiodiazotropha weberae]
MDDSELLSLIPDLVRLGLISGLLLLGLSAVSSHRFRRQGSLDALQDTTFSIVFAVAWALVGMGPKLPAMTVLPVSLADFGLALSIASLVLLGWGNQGRRWVWLYHLALVVTALLALFTGERYTEVLTPFVAILALWHGWNASGLQRRLALGAGILFLFVTATYWGVSAWMANMTATFIIAWMVYSIWTHAGLPLQKRRLLLIALVASPILLMLAGQYVEKDEDEFRHSLLEEAYARLDLARHRMEVLERYGLDMLKIGASDPITLRALAGVPGQHDLQFRVLNRKMGADTSLLLDTGGQVIVCSDPAIIGKNFAWRPFFKAAMAGDTSGYMARGSVTGLPRVFFARPVVDESATTRAVMVAGFNLDTLLGDNVRMDDVILNRQGVILFGPPPFDRGALFPIGAEVESLVHERLFDEQDLQHLGFQRFANDWVCDSSGRPWLWASSPLPGGDWELSKLLSIEPLLDHRARQLTQVSLFIAILVLLAVHYLQSSTFVAVLLGEVDKRRQAEMTLHQVIDTVPIRVFWKDRECHYLGCNPPFARDAGKASPDEMIGLDDFSMGWAEQAENYRADDKQIMETGQARLDYEEPQSTPDNRLIILRTSKMPLRDASGKIYGVLGIYEDITTQKQIEAQLKDAASVFEHATEGIIIASPAGVILDVNAAFTRITGYRRDEVLGQKPSILKSGKHAPEFYEDLWRSLHEEGSWTGEIWNRRKNGEIYPESLTISSVRSSDGQVQRYVALFSDIRAQKEHQSQLEHVAHYDALTGLPNRVLLGDRLRQTMLQASRRDSQLALVYLDLDGFKEVNDDYGHDVGDRLLVILADRMKNAVREVDTLARLGGDEFVALLADLPDVDTSLPWLQRLLHAIAEPVHDEVGLLQVSASLGVSFYLQAEPIDADQLLRQADQAMYQAKLAGKNRYHLFDAVQDRDLRGQHESVERIRAALTKREFVLHYQPKVDMRQGRVIGVEALIRWQNPEEGLLYPNSFLPTISDHPLMLELGDYVIESALAQIVDWRAEGIALPVSVNLDAMQLDQTDFTDKLRAALARYPKAEPGDLELEVLETSALEDINRVSQIIREVQELGVGFALDDFGTGYSSLTYLKRLPIQTLKIDQSFVRDMLDDPDDLTILDGTLSLAISFRRQVIAEGVESEAHGELLLQLGCELGQGYAIARPMPADQIPAWMANWQPKPAWKKAQKVDRNSVSVLFAMVEHRAWIRQIRCHLNDEQAAPPLDVHRCNLGVWLDALVAKNGADEPAITEIVTLHESIHRKAAELVDLKLHEGKSTAMARIEEIQPLHQALIAALRILIE